MSKENIANTNEQNNKLIEKDTEKLLNGTIEVGKAAIGAIVGLVIGGSAGAIIGAVSAPVLSLAQDFVIKVTQHRKDRLEKIVNNSIVKSGNSIEEALNVLNINEEKAEAFLSLLSSLCETDKAFDLLFEELLAELFNSDSDTECERLFIIADAIRHLRAIHLKILLAINNAGGVLSASEISNAVSIPEIELRSVVRELELRGMIKDLEVLPVTWKLRELGCAIVKYIEMDQNRSNEK